MSHKEFTFTREFDAPRDVVFNAWTKVDALAQWWGPKGFELKVATFDFRKDGIFHYEMVTPDGKSMWGKFVYGEIKAPQQFVFISSFADEKGNNIRNPWMSTWPLEIHNTVHFEEKNGKTTVTLQGGPHNASAEEWALFESAHANINAGFKGTFEQLDNYLEHAKTADRAMVSTRVFDAPRELVYQAWTTPEHLAQWFGPDGFSITTYKMDFSVGGVWKFDMNHAQHGTFPNRIKYLEIIPNEKLVYLHSDDVDNDPGAFHTTVTFNARGNKTEMTMRAVFGTAEQLNLVIEKYGALDGNRQTLNKLEAYLRTKV